MHTPNVLQNMWDVVEKVKMGQVFPEIFGFLFPVPFHSCPIFLKVACGAFSALQPVGRLYPCPNEFSSFSSRGATHHIGTRDLF